MCCIACCIKISAIASKKANMLEFTRRLQMLSDGGVEKIYQTAYRDCRFVGKKLPAPVALQQLVACWRVLRKSRAMGR